VGLRATAGYKGQELSWFGPRVTRLGAIFISYRRSDSQGESGRLFDDLVRQFGRSAVFMDVVGIDAGCDFRRAIDDSVQSCSILLAMVGPLWLEAGDEQGSRRLENEADYVRLEIAAALRRDIPVVPVLLRGAKMPRSEQLPEEIADLAYRNAVELSHARWKSDVQVLIKALRPMVGDTAPPAPSETPTSLDALTVQQIARELATYIGPIAEIVVNRKAPSCHSAEELSRNVATEIDSQSDRDKFLAALRH
jgi:TIR domain